jgi:aspartate aminotransferase
MMSLQALQIADRVKDLAGSPTVSVMDKARKLKAAGKDVVDLSGGDPDFDTAPNVTRAAVEALQAGKTHYAPSRGLPDLLKAVAHKTKTENGAEYDPSKEVIITPGAKTGLFTALQAVLNPGDEAILFDPCWVSYAPGVALAGAKPIHVTLECCTAPEELEARLSQAITPRTRVLILNSPNNPSGQVCGQDYLEVIARQAEAHNLLVFSDEIYEKLIYPAPDGSVVPHISIASLPGMRDRTLVVNGLSKSHAMTGWRLGWVLGPEAIISQMLKIHQHSTTCVTTFVQVGAVAALQGTQEYTTYMLGRYQARRDALVTGLNAMPGVTCESPAGTFYAFPDVRETGLADMEFTDRLLEQELVAVTPGSAFGPGGVGHIRLSFANSDEMLAEAVVRIGRFVKGL